jgi:hypothetical protein
MCEHNGRDVAFPLIQAYSFGASGGRLHRARFRPEDVGEDKHDVAAKVEQVGGRNERNRVAGVRLSVRKLALESEHAGTG